MNGKELNMMESGLTVIQRVAICFAAGVIGGLAVVLFSHVLFELGLSATLGVTHPVSLKPPDIYRPLFWAGLWGIPLGLFIKTVWTRLYLFGLLYFLAPVLALFTISAVRNNHRFDRQGDNREETVSRLHSHGIPPEVRKPKCNLYKNRLQEKKFREIYPHHIGR